VAEAAVTALTNSDLGKARQKIASLESDLAAAQAAVRLAADERGRFSEESLGLKGQLDQALREKGQAEAKVTVAEATASRLQSDLESKAALITQAQAEAATERNAAAQLRANANKGYEVLAPAKLKATDLAAQMQEMYQASLSGEVAAIAAWSALTTFASAQADPAAKDFQLQIVRRLGVVLVGYWKHQSLSEKDRHEKLSQWAKRLNEHADSRFNLLVPALGEPIDKTRMTCATSSTAIREVLCWQVRNPSGASFSLAEVA
jgi:chromosome segregation ATPase